MTKVYQVVVTYGHAISWAEVEVAEVVLITTLNAFEANRVWAAWNDNPEKRITSHGIMRNARIKTFILDEYVEPTHLPKPGNWFG